MPTAQGLCPSRLSRGLPSPASMTTALAGHLAPLSALGTASFPVSQDLLLCHSALFIPCLSVSLGTGDLTTSMASLLFTELIPARLPGSERPVRGQGHLTCKAACAGSDPWGVLPRGSRRPRQPLQRRAGLHFVHLPSAHTRHQVQRTGLPPRQAQL